MEQIEQGSAFKCTAEISTSQWKFNKKCRWQILDTDNFSAGLWSMKWVLSPMTWVTNEEKAVPWDCAVTASCSGSCLSAPSNWEPVSPCASFWSSRSCVLFWQAPWSPRVVLLSIVGSLTATAWALQSPKNQLRKICLADYERASWGLHLRYRAS